MRAQAMDGYISISGPYPDIRSFDRGNTTFSGNRALSGGALTSLRNTMVMVSLTAFVDNVALVSEALMARLFGGLAGSSGGTAASFATSFGCGEGGGGGICYVCTR